MKVKEVNVGTQFEVFGLPGYVLTLLRLSPVAASVKDSSVPFSISLETLVVPVEDVDSEDVD